MSSVYDEYIEDPSWKNAEKPFKIDGVAIPTPSKYEYSIEDLSSEQTGRTLDGEMHKDVVAVKDTYQCTWQSLSWDDASTLLKAVDGKTRVAFTHADPRIPNKFIIRDFYVGVRNGGALNLRSETAAWENISFTFIRI